MQVLDATTPAGKALVQMMGALAERVDGVIE